MQLYTNLRTAMQDAKDLSKAQPHVIWYVASYADEGKSRLTYEVTISEPCYCEASYRGGKRWDTLK